MILSTKSVRRIGGSPEIDDGLWDVYFGPLKLGRLNERRMLIEDEFGRLKRHNV